MYHNMKLSFPQQKISRYPVSLRQLSVMDPLLKSTVFIELRARIISMPSNGAISIDGQVDLRTNYDHLHKLESNLLFN